MRVLILSLCLCQWAVPLPMLNHKSDSPPLPPLSDLRRFPSKETCDLQLQFLKVRQKCILDQWLSVPDKSLDAWRQQANEDCRERFFAWENLACAYAYANQDGGSVVTVDADPNICIKYYYDPHAAGVELYNLRVRLGDDDYANGVMPSLMDPGFWWK